MIDIGLLAIVSRAMIRAIIMKFFKFDAEIKFRSKLYG